MEEKFVSIDLLWGKFANRFEGVNKLIGAAKQDIELTGDTPNKAVFKTIDKILYGKIAPVELLPEVKVSALDTKLPPLPDKKDLFIDKKETLADKKEKLADKKVI